MGFTISGMREIRERRLTPRRSWRHGRGLTVTAVAEYTGLWGWEVRPGNRVLPGGSACSGELLCSCGERRCPVPGNHPVAGAAPVPAGSTLAQVAAAWQRTPGAAVLLPTGVAFDVLEVPLVPGQQAVRRLERLGLPLGPVAAAPHGRLWFFTTLGTAARLRRLLDELGWDGAAPRGLRALGAGCHITAPPSRLGGLGPVRWLRPPDPASAAVPPGPLLLSAVTYTCHRADWTARRG